MVAKKFKNLLLVGGLTLSLVAAVPAVSRASHYTGKTPASIAGSSMNVEVPVTPVSVKKTVKKHAKYKAVKVSTKHHRAAKKKVHTTIVYKSHHHKLARKTAKPSA